MNEEKKLIMAMAIEMIVCICMICIFIVESNDWYKFFSLFLAIVSAGFAFEKRFKLLRLIEKE